MSSDRLRHPPDPLESPAQAPSVQPGPLPVPAPKTIRIQTRSGSDGLCAPDSPQPPTRTLPSQSDLPRVPESAPSIEDERFAYRCVRAVKLATAAMLAIQDQESFLRSRIKEEEMMLEMLQEEVEHTKSRTKTALYQVESLREGIEAYGVKLPDGAEIEALIRQPSPEPPQTPITPTRTPPAHLFQELLLDMLDRTPAPSLSSHTDASHSSWFSLQPQINLSSSEHVPSSPVPEALNSSASSDQASSQSAPSTSTFLTPNGHGCISESSGRNGE